MEVVARFESSLTEEGRYRLLVDAITDYAICMLDRSGTVTSWNAGARRLKGYEAQEILGKHFSIFYTEQDQRGGLPNRALETSAAAGIFEGEGWRIRKDGSRFWAHVVIDPIRDSAGELVGFAKVTRDLSERKTAADIQRRTDDQFRLLVQSVTDYAIYLLDPVGKVRSWNTGAQRIKGYPANEIIGRHFSVFYTEDDRHLGEPRRALRTAIRDGHFENEGWLVRKNGDAFWAHVVIDPIRNDNGAIIGFAKITRDMTAKRKSGLALESARTALFHSQKMESIGQLTGGIAHDFNNLLAAVLGGLEIVRSRLPETPNITPLLDAAIQSAHRGAALTQRMLSFARRQELKPEPVDLSALVHGMIDLLQRSLGPSVTIETRFPAFLDAVRVDPNQLELALINLAMNARDAMPDGGPIVISARPANDISDENGEPRFGRYVCVSVGDAGEGMDQDVLQRAMEPFYSTKGVGRGAGLGLSMVYGLAEQSGGHFSLKSRKGEGTVAELLLPVAVGSAAAAGHAGAVSLQKAEKSCPLAVLTVDDNQLILANTSAMLEKLGHTVFGATSGAQALGVIREERIDLVLIDHSMPDMTGEDLAEAIRSEWPSMALVLGTPLADASVQKLAKPFRQADLAGAIAKVKHGR